MEAQRCHQPPSPVILPQEGSRGGLLFVPLIHFPPCSVPQEAGLISAHRTCPVWLPAGSASGNSAGRLLGRGGRKSARLSNSPPSLASVAPQCLCLSMLATVLTFLQSWGHLSASSCPFEPAGSDGSPPLLAPSGCCRIPCRLP